MRQTQVLDTGARARLQSDPPMPIKNLALKIAILKSGREQRAVAQAAGLHETQLSHLVAGRREPTDAERKALARVLKTRVADLVPEPERAALRRPGPASPAWP